MAQQTILVIDDHAFCRAGMASMLATAFDVAHLFDCSSLDDALTKAVCDPTVVLLDIQLPGRSGLDGMGLIRQRWPAARMIVVSAHDRPDMIEAALARGAVAFCLRPIAPGG